MPTPDEDHAWRSYRTTKDRLDAVAEPAPRRRGGPALCDRIAAVIAAGIEDRVWRQGEKLPPAAPIAERFGVSTYTARAALQALIAQGYAERQTGGATYCRGAKAGPR